jgi:hypothetical protein
MNVIGIDVSKAKLDCAWLDENNKVKAKVFPNALAGWSGLVEWSLKDTGLAVKDLHFVMDDCMDAGGRANAGAIAGAAGVYHGQLAATSMAKAPTCRSSTRRKPSFTGKA